MPQAQPSAAQLFVIMVVMAALFAFSPRVPGWACPSCSEATIHAAARLSFSFGMLVPSLWLAWLLGTLDLAMAALFNVGLAWLFVETVSWRGTDAFGQFLLLVLWLYMACRTDGLAHSVAFAAALLHALVWLYFLPAKLMDPGFSVAVPEVGMRVYGFWSQWAAWGAVALTLVWQLRHVQRS